MANEVKLEPADKNKFPENMSAENELTKLTGSRTESHESRSKIRFNLDVSFAEVQARGMMTSAECRSIWYQPSDFSRISSQNRSATKMAREFGSQDDDEDLCIRGLEHKLHGDSEHVKTIRVNAIYAVLKEQSRQRKSNIRDEQKIAELYRQHVFSSVKLAQERGCDDEKIAKQSLRQDQNRKSFSSMAAFDDFDLKELQQLGLHDDMDRFEWRMSEVKLPKDLYENHDDEKARRKLKKSSKIREWASPRSISPKRTSDPKERSTGRRSVSPKPGVPQDREEGGIKPLRKVLSGGLLMILGASNHDKSPQKPRKSSRDKSPKQLTPRNSQTRLKELPLPGRRPRDQLGELPMANKQTLSPPRTGLRKIRSDMF